MTSIGPLPSSPSAGAALSLVMFLKASELFALLLALEDGDCVGEEKSSSKPPAGRARFEPPEAFFPLPLEDGERGGTRAASNSSPRTAFRCCDGTEYTSQLYTTDTRGSWLPMYAHLAGSEVALTSIECPSRARTRVMIRMTLKSVLRSTAAGDLCETSERWRG